MVATAKTVIKKVTAFLEKKVAKAAKEGLDIEKSWNWGETEQTTKGYGGSTTIRLATDGDIYEWIYDPYGSLWGYKIHGEFNALLKKLGWASEREGYGVLILYKR